MLANDIVNNLSAPLISAGLVALYDVFVEGRPSTSSYVMYDAFYVGLSTLVSNLVCEVVVPTLTTLLGNLISVDYQMAILNPILNAFVYSWVMSNYFSKSINNNNRDDTTNMLIGAVTSWISDYFEDPFANFFV